MEIREELRELILSFHIYGSSKVQTEVVSLYMASASPTEPSHQPPSPIPDFCIFFSFFFFSFCSFFFFFEIVSVCDLGCPGTHRDLPLSPECQDLRGAPSHLAL